MDYRAIARSITDPENQPHQWSDEDLAQFFISAADKIERLREALHMWDYLIEHQYTGSREAMSDMMDAAQHTARLLYGDPPWPSPRPALQQKESE